MAQIGTYIKPAPIGSGVVTTDHVIAQGYDFVYLKMGGMLKVQESQVDGDLVLGAGAAYVPPAVLAITTNLTATKAFTDAQTFELSIAGSGGVAPYSVEWYKDGAKIANANSTTLNLGTATTAMAGKYTAVYKDAMGKSVNSVECTVTITEA